MQTITQFVGWFLTNIPDFFMSEPIIYFIGLFMLGYILKLIVSLRS